MRRDEKNAVYTATHRTVLSSTAVVVVPYSPHPCVYYDERPSGAAVVAGG